MTVHTTEWIAMAIGMAACVTDLRTRRIPNLLTFGGAAAALAFHAYTGGVAGLGSATLAWFAGVILFFPPFALRGMGAGDLKLVAALGAWLGPAATLWLALYTGVAGGVLALAVAASTGYLGRALSNIRLLLVYWSMAGVRPLDEVSLANAHAPRLAYAIPIFAGMLVTIWLQ